jgi:hypothetical protein
MTQRTDTPRVKAEPITTVAEIDEAIYHASRNTHRDHNWQRWIDALLDQRNRLAANTNPPTTLPDP